MRTSRLCLGLVLLLSHLCHAQPYDLWLYHSSNLLLDKNVDDLERLWTRAAKAGYTHVLLSDPKLSQLTTLGDNKPHYLANLARVRKIGADLKLDVVPAVCRIGFSNSLLANDPNLAEGLPVKDTLFVVKDGRASLVPDPPVRFARPDLIDDTVHRYGNVAAVEDNAGNARFAYKLDLAPFRCYRVTVSVRTRGYTAEPEIHVLPVGKPKVSLQYQPLGVKRDQDWTTHQVLFNTLDNTGVRVYFGVWERAHGKLEWRDWSIEEVGLLNVLRREGTPLTVRAEGGLALVEGKDFDPVADPHLGNSPWPGEYEVRHAPPTIRTGLPDGTRLRVSWYHPVILYSGGVCCCPSDPKINALLADQADQMRTAFGATSSFMMSHDEIRILNWDVTCQDRHLTPAQILAQSARDCAALFKGSRLYIWSDMFDPHHNAHDDYYFVHGDLTGSWEGLDPSVTVVNWNFGHRSESLKFFADRGHPQVIAGYYDSNVTDITKWLDAAKGIRNVTGVMYTTWENKYDDLERFADLTRSAQR